MSAAPYTDPTDQPKKPESGENLVQDAVAADTSGHHIQNSGAAPPPASLPYDSSSMSAPSLLGRRRLTAPPQLIGLSSSSDPRYMPHSIPDTQNLNGMPPSIATGTSSTPFTSASGMPYGAHLPSQQHHPWMDPMYQPVNSGLASPYGYSTPVPPHMYAFRPADNISMTAQGRAPALRGENPLENSTNSSPDFAQTFYDPFQVKHRRRTTAPQLKVLEAQFAANPKPDIPVRKALAEELGMTPREVQVWFQNRRAKSKRLEKKAQSGVEGATGPSQLPASTDNFAANGSTATAAPPEAPTMSDRQRSEQQYFNALAKAEQQATAGAAAPLPQASSQVGPQSFYSKPSDSAPNPISHQSQLLHRRMTMPPDNGALSYQANALPVASYPSSMWPPPQPTASRHSPQAFAQAPPGAGPEGESVPSGSVVQPSLSRLQIPANNEGVAQLAVSSGSMMPAAYGPYRSPLNDPFSPASFADDVSPGAPESSTSYFSHPPDLSSSVFGLQHPEDPYYHLQRRQHSSGSISSTGDSSTISYDPGTGAMTPTSSLSFSTAATTPTEYLPPGFDTNSRRASCPAEFIASFDGMSMPQHYPGTPSNMPSLNLNSSNASQPLTAPAQYAQLPVDMASGGLNPSVGPRRHSIATGPGNMSGAEDYSFMPPPGHPNPNRSPSYVAQRTLTPGHLDPIAEAPQVHQPRALSPTQTPQFLKENNNQVESPKEELRSDQELYQQGERPSSPASKKAGLPSQQTARKSRSSSSVKSVYSSKSSEKLAP